MKIIYFEIQNFRKLKCCRIEIGEKQTVLVGANNSGKTSAIDALILFLKNERRKYISTTDFTLSNWQGINQIGEVWSNTDPAGFNAIAKLDKSDPNRLQSLYLEDWRQFLPSIDLWVKVDNSEVHYVSHLIPTLSWTEGLIGVRLTLEPKVNNEQLIETLYKDYLAAIIAVRNTISAAKPKGQDKEIKTPKLWPQSLREFLDKELHKYFNLNAYILDPSKLNDPADGIAAPQILSEKSIPISPNPFNGLFKIDVINAQRGFSDVNTSDSPTSGIASLSSQLRSYYDKHLDPSEFPGPEDIDALLAIDDAKDKFDIKLKSSFNSAISELEDLGYPGFTDPKIIVTSSVNPIEGLNHDSAVQFSVGKSVSGQQLLTLPEKYNGLGYQNLVSMVFKLIRFRDEWMRVGKFGKAKENDDSIIEPLHLVLIEEPEAHLHAQVQQVFIKNAYKVLRKSNNLSSNKFVTQMIVSTHSSHIAHEVDFSCLRYFRRKPSISIKEVPCASLVNLSETFGNESTTSKFATRYLKATHCDLFFADAVILVEGPAERMLVPHFIKNRFPKLDSRYITILEIGGSHAHTLQPLIEKLGILCLIITDLDSMKLTDAKEEKVLPERDKAYITNNDTLKKWVPQLTDLNELLDCKKNSSANGLIRVAYQNTMYVTLQPAKKPVEAIPYTFEDALALTNIDLFRKIPSSKGLLKKVITTVLKSDIKIIRKDLFEYLSNSPKKAEMALDLLYLEDPSLLFAPQYIIDGLDWLQSELSKKDDDVIIIATDNGEKHE